MWPVSKKLGGKADERAWQQGVINETEVGLEGYFRL